MSVRDGHTQRERNRDRRRDGGVEVNGRREHFRFKRVEEEEKQM